MQTIALILPTYNAENDLSALLPAIKQQSLQPTHFLVIDSSSTDQTRAILQEFGATVHVIDKSQFNHGGTRRLATALIEADIYIMMTQDAIPAHPDTFKNLINALIKDDHIGVAYGRQLPKKEANSISAHGRYANYPADSYLRNYSEKATYGIKTCFNSDNLAAYRQTALQKSGGFPKNVLTAEDMYVAARMLQAGFSIHYAADAVIYHSHNFSLTQEFHRYFSIGVFHRQENWILQDFSSATKAGMGFILSEMAYLCRKKQIHLIPKAILSTIVKYAAYQVGKHENMVPFAIKRNWGINKSYWLQYKVNQPNT